MHDDVTFALRRARLRRAIVPVVLLVVGVLVIRLAVVTVNDPISGAASSEAKIGGTIAAFMVVVGAWMLWRALTVRVVITRSEVILRNVAGTRRVPFSEIAGFELFRTNDFGRPRTVLRLVAGRHGIPRSFPVAGASTETLSDAWLTLASRSGANMGWTGRVGAGTGSVIPNTLGKVPRGVAELIAEMNEALDARRGPRHRTAELLTAAHPRFRTVLHDD